MRTTTLRESSFVDLEGTEAERLLADDLLWQLVQRRYVSVEHSGPSRIRVAAKTYIGRAAIADSTIEIIEKIPGETAALMRQATFGAFKVESLARPGGLPGPLIALLVHQFLLALAAYASSGRQAIYHRRREVSSLVGGRIRMVDTIHLRARGLGHRIAFDRTVLAHDTPLNRGLLASVRQVEQIARGTDLVGKDLTKARVLSMVFEDCLDGRFLTTPRRAFLADLEVAQRDPFAKRNRDLAALAAAVLDRVSLDEPDPSAGLVPRAWFLDLGRLFEDVVTRELRSVVAPGLRVEEGSTTLPRMFDAVSNRYRADPDLVVKQGMRTVVVGDVKHKSWTGIASEDDLYQLLAHTAAFGARDCFLIYPHVSFEEVSLGINPLGGKTRLFAVDVKQLDRDLALVADGLGLARLGAAA